MNFAGLSTIDVHCHILPGIDDGARDKQESLEMGRLSVQNGTRRIITTPHHFPRSGLTAVEEAAKRVEALQRHLTAADVPLTLYTGQEIAVQPDLPRRLAQGEVVPLNGTPYILVEPPFVDYGPYVDDLLYQLQLQGMTPVLAHPERCAGIQRDPGVVYRLVQRGVVMQINTGSLLGHYGGHAKETVETLLLRNMVHVMATDAHSTTGMRVPNMVEGLTALTQLIGQERALAMVTTTPHAIIEGRPVEQIEPLEKPERKPGGLFSGLFKR